MRRVACRAPYRSACAVRLGGIVFNGVSIRFPHGVQSVSAVCGRSKICYFRAVFVLNRAVFGRRPALKGPADKRIPVCGEVFRRIVNVSRIFRIAAYRSRSNAGFIGVVNDLVFYRRPIRV